MVWKGMKETRLPGKQNTIMSSHGPRDVSLTSSTTETSTVIFYGLEKGTSSEKRRISLKKKLATRKMWENITLLVGTWGFALLYDNRSKFIIAKLKDINV